jgi:hypothetical protein
VLSHWLIRNIAQYNAGNEELWTSYYFVVFVGCITFAQVSAALCRLEGDAKAENGPSVCFMQIEKRRVASFSRALAAWSSDMAF